MNITLLNPKLKTWSPNVYAPLGLAYIASALESIGHKVKIIDLNSRNISDSKLKNQVSDAGMVGIGGMITEYHEVVRLTRVVRESNQGAKIILGGALATTWTEKVLSNSDADIAVIGEGEETIVKLMEAIKTNQDFSTMKGIAFKKDGVVKINPVAEPIMDLDSILFPARHLLDMNRYTTHHFKSFGMKIKGNVKSTTLITSRGCPYGCVFCYHEVWGHKWRGRTPDNIIREMKELKRDYGFNGFVFNDDTMVVDRQRIKEFCNKLIDKKLDIQWYCNGRVNLMNEELIRLMAKSGCKGIAYGIESGNQQILNFIKKGITLEQVEQITKITKQAGIHVTGYFMLGMLGETRKTIQQTIDFARKLNLDFYGFNLTTPMQGTVLYKLAEEKGLITSEELQDWSVHAITNLTDDCTIKELERFNEQAFREFTLQKRYGGHYLFNPLLWLQGIRTMLFLTGKRSYRQLFNKVWGILIRR